MASNCRFTSDAEDYTADVLVLENSVMVICEVENEGRDYAKRFRAYNITDNVKQIDTIDFNNFENCLGVKNPSFVKFDTFVGILYTHIISDAKRNVNLLIMNYPECKEISGNVAYYAVCPNGKQTKLLGNFISTLMVNPYPSSMKDVKVNFRFTNLNDMVVSNGDIDLRY